MPAYPTQVHLTITCGQVYEKNYTVDVDAGGNVRLIQSDPMKAGHSDCNVTVDSVNLSGNHAEENHTFSKLMT